MKKRNRKVWISVIVLSLISLTACNNEIHQNEIEDVQFSEYFNEEYEKLNFDAEIVIPSNVDVNHLFKYKGNRAMCDIEKTYEVFWGDEKIQLMYEGKVRGDDGNMILDKFYTSDAGENFSLNPQCISYNTPFSSYILRCIFPEKRNPRYNLDQYDLNGELAFMGIEKGYEDICSMLREMQFDIDMDFFMQAFGMKHEVLMEEEYAIDMQGNEDPSQYKENWTEEDDSYYYFLRQKIDGLPVYYMYGDIFTEMEVWTAPVQVIYSQNGIQKFDIDKLFKIDDSTRPVSVSLLDMETLAQRVEEQYNLLISDNKLNVYYMELCMMAQLDNHDGYDIFPVWVMSLEEIIEKDREEKKILMQNIVDAVTGTIIF